MRAKPAARAARKPKGRGGRPSKYDPSRNEEVENYCMLGAKNDELAQFLGVCSSTIDNWLANDPEFLGAVKRGRDFADANVGKRLYERAMGYSHPEDKIFQYEGDPVVVPTTKHYPPDITAAIFWLKNRRPRDWRDKKEVEHSGNVSLISQILDEDDES